MPKHQSEKVFEIIPSSLYGLKTALFFSGNESKNVTFVDPTYLLEFVNVHDDWFTEK